MDDFAGRVAVVTGAGSGIGQGIVRAAAKEGMKVVVADVEHGALEATASELRAGGTDVLVVPTDVSDPARVDALADAAYERFGAVHLLCNNAGVFQAGVIWQRTVADWEWVMGVNFYGVLHGIRSFVPRMIEGGEPGHIVNTSSMAGIMTVAFSGPYVVSKFAAAGVVPRAGIGRHAHRRLDPQPARRAAVGGAGARPLGRRGDAQGHDREPGHPPGRGGADRVRGGAGGPVLDLHVRELRAARPSALRRHAAQRARTGCPVRVIEEILLCNSR
jgi:hypothetical protein